MSNYLFSEFYFAQMSMCAAFHGGPLDYPKSMTRSIGSVVDKWDICYEKVQAVIAKENKDGSILANK